MQHPPLKQKNTTSESVLQQFTKQTQQQHPVLIVLIRYLLPIGLVTMVILLKLWLESVIQIRTPFLLLTSAIIISAWYGGLRGGIIALTLSLVAGKYFFLPPYQSLAITTPNTITHLGMFIVEAIFLLGAIYKRRQSMDTVHMKAVQQAVIAEIGKRGVEGYNVGSLMRTVVHYLALTTGAEYTAIFDLLPEGQALRLRAGTGWKKGITGNTIVNVEKTSQTGYVLASQQPLVITDIRKDKRFSRVPLFKEHAIISSVQVVIRGTQRPFGILGIYSTKQRTFKEEDIDFLQSIAHILGTTIDRQRSMDTLTFLANTSSTFTSSLDERVTLNNITRLAVPELADWCLAALVTNNELDKTAVAATNTSHEKRLQELLSHYHTTPVIQEQLVQWLQVKTPRLITRIPTDWTKLLPMTPVQKRVLGNIKPQSLIAIPLQTKKRYYGTILLVSSTLRERYNQTHVLMARELANRAAIAIENARLFQESQAAIQARDEFLSIASHELKTPLTTMLLQLQSVMYNMKNQTLANFSIDRMMTMLESTEKQSKRLARLINDLLNTSLISTGRIELEKEKTDLPRLVRDVTTRFNAQLEQTNTPLTLHAEKAVTVFVDRLRVEQVVTNLISNAIKYGKGKPIIVSVEKTATGGKVSVQDSGIGIPIEKQKLIFDRFERGVSSKEYRGLGVGLYIAKQIVLGHGGTIYINSILNEGSTFSVEFPFDVATETTV